MFDICFFKSTYFLGTLSPLSGVIKSRRLSLTAHGLFVPYYTVAVGGQVLPHTALHPFLKLQMTFF